MPDRLLLARHETRGPGRAALWSAMTALALICTATTSRGLTIALDFSQESTIFASGQARAAAQAAANDLGAAITSTLNRIATDVWEGSYQSTTAAFDFQYGYLDPTLGADQSTVIPGATLPFDTVNVIVRSRSIGDPNVLGEGGPAGIGAQIMLQGIPSQGPLATNNAAGKAQTAYLRGGAGPTIGTLRGSENDVWDGVPFPYAIDYGVGYGAIWLDTDDPWHDDHTVPVPAGKYDIYSVALHEMMHVLGFGNSATWESLRSGNNWLGPEASDLAGSGNNLINGTHIAFNTRSPRLIDGVLQEVAMDPNLTRGTRKQLTLLDLAFMRDLGWETAVPEYPGDFNHNGLVEGSDLVVWADDFGVGRRGDADNDGDSDGLDFLIWQQNRGLGAAAAIGAIPEPSALALALATLVVALSRPASS